MTTSAKSVSQSDEALNFLGKTLCSDFQASIAEFLTGWLTEDYSIAENYGELLNLAKSVRQVMQLEEDFTAFEEWLTSGFIPEELVVQPMIGKSKVKSQRLKLPLIKEDPKLALLNTGMIEADTETRGHGDTGIIVNFPRSSHPAIMQCQNFSEDWAKFDLRTDSQETEIQQTDEVSSISTITPISSYSQEPNVLEFPAQIPDSSGGFRENDPTQWSQKLTINDLVEKRSRQNNSMKKLRELAQMLDFSSLTPETIGVNTENFPTSAGEIPQELNNQEIEEISSVSTIVPISYYSQEPTVLEFPAQIPDSSGGLRENDPTQRSQKLTINGLVEKRSRQNHSVKGLQELARLLDFSPPTAETIGVNTENFPTSAGEIPQELTEEKSDFLAQDDNSQNFFNEEVLNLDRDDLLIPTKEKRSESNPNYRMDGVSTKNISLEDNSRPKLSDRFDSMEEQKIEIDEVMDALTEEINREYRRFYGH